MELDPNNSSSNRSAPSSPIAGSTHRRLRPLHEIQPHPHPHRPTIEQNMAFAALQQSQQEFNVNNLAIGPTTTNPTDRSNKRI
jgi:hypothetical protein